MALLDVPVAKKVSEVPKDGKNTITHVGEHSHQKRSLFKGFHKGLLVQVGVVCDILVLRNIKVKEAAITTHIFVQITITTEILALL